MKNHVRRYRFEAGDMTQQELADKVGVTRQTILSIEKGKFKPAVELALLGCGILLFDSFQDFLFGGGHVLFLATV